MQLANPQTRGVVGGDFGLPTQKLDASVPMQITSSERRSASTEMSAKPIEAHTVANTS